MLLIIKETSRMWIDQYASRKRSTDGLSGIVSVWQGNTVCIWNNSKILMLSEKKILLFFPPGSWILGEVAFQHTFSPNYRFHVQSVIDGLGIFFQDMQSLCQENNTVLTLCSKRSKGV